MVSLKPLTRHWHDVGIVSAVVAGAYLAVAWNDIGFLHKLVLLNFIVVLLHQFEEYSWPGGFPAMANLVLMTGKFTSRFFMPINQLSSAAANLTFTYVFYLLPVFFPHTIWLGLATVLQGLLQVLAHGVLGNYMIRSLYNPGVVTAVFGWLPVGVIYIYYVQKHGLASGWEWLAAVGYMIVALALIFYVIEQRIFGGENPPYPFDEDEMERGGIKQKLERASDPWSLAL